MNKVVQPAGFLSSFALILLLSACSVTMPASETMMFQQNEKLKQKQDRLFQEPHQYERSPKNKGPWYRPRPFLDKVRFSLSASPLIKNELAYAKDKFASYVEEKKQEPDIQDGDFSIPNSHNIAFAVPIPIKKTKRFAVSANAGIPVLGVDMTAKTFKNTFATVNLSYLSGEAMLQYRLLNKEKIGIALGPHFRLQRRWLQVTEGPDESFGVSTIVSMLTPARIYYNKTIGLRSVFYFPINEKSYIHAVVAPGYSTNLEQATVNVGISLKFEL